MNHGIDEATEKTVAIVGGGAASVQAISSLRSAGWAGVIRLFSEEATLPYQRPPLSKKYFSGDIDDDALSIKPASFYAQLDVDVHLGAKVASVSREEKTLSLTSQETFSFDHMILATGARARSLPIPGSDLDGIHYLRGKDDVDNIRKSLESGMRLLIVGAGYIGLEVAASAVQQGIDVTVVEAMDRVLARVTSPEVSTFYRTLHSEQGVDIRLQTGLESFVKNDSGIRAKLADGSILDCDIAIVGIGVLPNIELAEDAGLACENGIVVDEHCRTSDKAIYAIGDCSNHHSLAYDRRIRLESVPNAVEQAKVAAGTICGAPVIYDQIPWFWSDQYDVKLQTVGLFQGYDQTVVRKFQQCRKLAVFYLQGGRLIAVDALNCPAEFMVSKKLVANGATPDPALLADSAIGMKELLPR